MDIVKNPFAPCAGSPPPELAGRSAILDRFCIESQLLIDGDFILNSKILPLQLMILKKKTLTE